ncbi:MAG TPA: ATP-binding protein [Steroidobacteraceae bacterium]|nr:ATP-binding protein [Steroidobacteraceae bacterium]
MVFSRKLVDELADACRRRPALIQVIAGPRQVGKTTAAEQLLARLGWPNILAAADLPLPPGPEWIETQWRLARTLKPAAGQKVLLVLDEVQKVAGWSEVVKRLWDEEKRSRGPVLPVLLGSSALLVQKGLTESLAGRFFLHRCPHWSWQECRAAFRWSWQRWVYFGGYPGAASLVRDEPAWKRYIADSLIETVLARDVLQLQPVTKPALLRHLFALAAAHPAQMLSYNKMLGQLQDAGNTTTLANYLRLLETAYLVSGLELFSRGQIRKRGSSPKLVLWNNALVNALSLLSSRQAMSDGAWWGRLVENAVGAHLLNGLHGPDWSVTYWRDGDLEVDFVVAHGARVWALEVKSGRPGKAGGVPVFRKRYPGARVWLLGQAGISLPEFFSRPAVEWFT